jgi:UDP-3-O-[3-hydroxymyristoyl] glucosamine N-acyltransferase
MSAFTVAQIAEMCGGHVEGDPHRLITGANALQNALPSDLSFVANRKAIQAASSSNAGCLLVQESFTGAGPWALVRVPEPRTAFARALSALYPATKPVPFIHPTAVIAETAELGSNCFIGSGCVIGDQVHIGDNTTLYANVTIYDNVRIGSRVILHAGCVVGADGFGFNLVGEHYEKFPQVGTVEIGDDVEIGANCCIDRAALGVTRIGQGTKFDNLVHVAHNCSIGKHVVVAAQTGFSGSAVVGDYAVVGGQVGIGENAKIESRAIVGGKAGILTSQTVHAGEPVWGIPARPLRQHLKGLASVSKLPELRKQVFELRQKIVALEAAECDEKRSR